MLGNVVRIIKAVVVTCIITIVSAYAYAGVVHIPLEIPCSRNPMIAPYVIFGGMPGVKYTLTTVGLRVDGGDEIEEIVNSGGLEKTRYGLYTYVGARCIPTDEAINVSLSGSSIMCNEGEGIKVRMLEPNGSNSDQYHYVGVLTITYKEEKKQKTMVTKVKEISNLDIEFKSSLLSGSSDSVCFH